MPMFPYITIVFIHPFILIALKQQQRTPAPADLCNHDAALESKYTSALRECQERQVEASSQGL